jgi:hypothetical protein
MKTAMLAEKKDAIRRRLLVSRYPRRDAAIFEDANDHNPLVLEDCPSCRGSGKRCSQEGSSYALDTCASCEGTGITFNIVPYFSSDAPAEAAIVDAAGWLKCPGCRRRFAMYDKRAWTGRRHRCGQKIDITKGGAAP